MPNKTKKTFLFNFFLSLIFLMAPLFFLIASTPEEENFYLEGSDSDAIAVRVIPNPDNRSVQQWYKASGFSGSPQSMIVDGYKAIRDGRTVYVAAANVDLEEEKIYFNIYLISYNQEADDNTVDIFGKILQNWKLNTNLNSEVGYCSFATKTCESSSDCPSGYICAGTDGRPGEAAHQKNRCIVEEDEYRRPLINTPVCLLDSECPSGLFCDSPKAMLLRDIDRIEKIKTINIHLEAYKKLHGRYPVLSSGTYVPYVAISSWPSWRQVFLSQIGASSEIDPINRITSCYEDGESFDLTTCWEDKKSSFLSVKEPINANNFALPDYSSVFSYVSSPDGSSANLYSIMELLKHWGKNFLLPTGERLNDFLPPYLNVDSSDQGQQLPYFVSYVLTGHSGELFEGSIEARDPQGRELTWAIGECVPGKKLFGEDGVIVDNCPEQSWSNWSPSNNLPRIEFTESSEKIYLRAPLAGDSQAIDSSAVMEKIKTYIVGVSIKNAFGVETIENFPIYITNENPLVGVPGDNNISLDYNDFFSIDIPISDSNKLKHLKLCYVGNNNCWDIDTDNDGTTDLDGSYPLENNLIAILETIDRSQGEYILKIQNKHSLSDGGGGFKEEHLGEHEFKIIAEDPYQAKTSVDFNITFSALDPVVDFSNCPATVAVGNNYECTILSTNPSRPIAVLEVMEPHFLSVDSDSHVLSGIADSKGQKTIKVKITNHFGLTAEGTRNFNVYDKPEVETVRADNIGSSFFSCLGKIVSTGGNTTSAAKGCAVLEKTSGDPVISNASGCNASGCNALDGCCSSNPGLEAEGTYSHSLTDLKRSTEYNYRAYAVNEAGISYGEVKSFKTRVAYPEVMVKEKESGDNVFIFQGKVEDDGGGDGILKSGFVWSNDASANFGDIVALCANHPNNCVFSNIYDALSGDFLRSVDLLKFEVGETYYYKAFAVNQDDVGQRVGLSESKSFLVPHLPILETTVDSTTSTSVKINGHILNISNIELLSSAVVYKEHGDGEEWNITNAAFSVEGNEGLVKFTFTQGGLSPGMDYYIQVIVDHELGTLEGEIHPFTTKKTGSITYNGNGNTGGTPPNLQTGDVGDEVIVLENTGGLVKPGYSFSNWNTKADGSGDTYTASSFIKITESGIILYAKWTPIKTEVSLKDGNSIVKDVVATYGEDMPEVIGYTAPSKSGYTFGGYYESAGGGGTQYYDSLMNSAHEWDKAVSEATLYAKWIAKKTTIILDKQDGSGETSSVNAYFGQPMPVASTPSRAGYEFWGYYDEMDCHGKLYYNKLMASVSNWNKDVGTATLYACWEAKTYTITFNPGEGSVSPTSKEVVYDAPVSSLPTPTRASYDFGGWWTGQGGGGTRYYSSTIYKNTANTTLYAKWTPSVAVPTVTIDDLLIGINKKVVAFGSVANNGGAVVSERGLVYSNTNTSPTIGASGCTKLAAATGSDSWFSRETSTLSSGTYYFRTYAINSAGTGYSPVRTVVIETAATMVTLTMKNIASQIGYIIFQDYCVAKDGFVSDDCNPGGTCYVQVEKGDCILLKAIYNGFLVNPSFYWSGCSQIGSDCYINSIQGDMTVTFSDGYLNPGGGGTSPGDLINLCDPLPPPNTPEWEMCMMQPNQ